MTKDVSDFKKFSIAQVEERILNHILNTPDKGMSTVSEADHVVRASIRHVFNVLAECNSVAQFPNQIVRNRHIADLATNMISHRFDMTRDYMRDFFPSRYAADYNGLMAAVVANDFVHSLNNLPGSIASNAAKYWSEAAEITQNGLPDDIAYAPSMEAVFLAHLNAFDVLLDIEREGLEDRSEEELRDILDRKIAPIRTFTHYHKNIGMDLTDHLEAVEAEIHQVMSDLRTPAPQPVLTKAERPYLRLVHSSPSPENL